MSNDEIFTAEQRLALIGIVRQALAEERDEFWVPQPRHFQDHEFLTAARTGVSWARKTSIGFIVVATLSFLGGAIWMAIKAAITR